jgi:hypothetical protein
MGVYMLVFIGGTPIGSMSLGWVAENIGVRVAIFGCGVIVAAVAAMTLLVPLARITPEAPGIEEDTTLESPRS